MTFVDAANLATPEASVSASALTFAALAAVFAAVSATCVAKATASGAVATMLEPFVNVIAPSFADAVKTPAPLTPTVPVANVFAAVTLPAAAVVPPTEMLPAVLFVTDTFLPPFNETPANAPLTVMSVVAAALTPAMFALEETVRFETPVQVDTSAAVIAAVETRLTVSMFLTVAPAAADKSALTTFNASVPAPPSMLSSDVKVPVTALNVSLPAPPTKVSMPEDKVKVAFGIATIPAAAKVPPRLPVVCDKAKAASTVALNAVA